MRTYGIEDFYGQPPEPPAEVVAMWEEEENLKDKVEAIRECQDAWSDLNSSLHALNAPPEVVAGWDLVKPWLDAMGLETTQEFEALQERMSNAYGRA